MDKERLLKASERTALFLEGELNVVSGQLKAEDVRDDLAAQYKLPTLLLLTGRSHLAHKVLDNLKQSFMQQNGDFISYPVTKSGAERKTDDQALAMYWPYINGWIAMGAHRLGRFDISVPARAYVEGYYNKDLKGYGISNDSLDNGKAQDVDVFMSSHLGLLALYCGDVERAKAVGECLERFVALQPDVEKQFLLRMGGTSGELVTSIPETDAANFIRVSRTEPNQLMFLLGYPLMFLYYLHLATTPTAQTSPYLDTAEKILQFVLTCNETLYTFFLSHKLSIGAALISKATGKNTYMQLSEKIVDNLLKLQGDDGGFLKDLQLPLLARLDQSTEIALWFLEIASRVLKL